MGNTGSFPKHVEDDDIWWTNGQNKSTDVNKENSISLDRTPARLNQDTLEDRSLNQLSKRNTERFEDFKLELERKHEKRRQIISGKHKEMEELRNEVERLKKENVRLKEATKTQNGNSIEEFSVELERLRNENEELRCKYEEKCNELSIFENIAEKNRELRIDIVEMQKEVQRLNSEILDFEKERLDYKAHVVALKDVITVSKQMLKIRDVQLNELKEKIESIEASLVGKEMNILSQDLRSEYERQLENIRNLRILYEERQRADRRAKEELASRLEDIRKELEAEQKKVSEREERITELETENSNKYDEIKSLESNLGLAKAECRQHEAELTVINQLFSEILLGFNNSQEFDLDKLVKLLEEHHDLLQKIVADEESTEVASALPKVFLDLVYQVDNKENEKQVNSENNESVEHNSEYPKTKLETIAEESETPISTLPQLNSAAQIVEILPKVWRVLIELLSHQTAPVNNLTENEDDHAKHPCYKLVETPKGPSLVLSVSQTFIRLKDLILEKKSLEKETNNLKQLNTHLENRLQEQEKRLELVSSELSKTWHVVGKLQKQHQLLHTQEKILRYELAQKRKLLMELKEELEYSREKSLQAKEKNSNTEEQWKQLRSEFALRKNTIEDSNNSVESGYSDERECSSDDEPGYETDISECNQKISSSDDVESEIKSPAELEPGISNSDNTDSILTLIKDEIAEIVQSEIVNGIADNIEDSSKLRIISTTESVTSNITNEVSHCDAVKQKTDSVQNENSEKTEADSTNLDCSDSASKVQENTSDEAQLEDQHLAKELLTEADQDQVRLLSSRTATDIVDIQPGTSHVTEKTKRTLEEVLLAREERLKRLEGQCEQLVTKVTNTNNRGIAICNKLEGLHEVYGESSSSETTENVPAEEVDLDNSCRNNNNNNDDDNSNQE